MCFSLIYHRGQAEAIAPFWELARGLNETLIEFLKSYLMPECQDTTSGRNAFEEFFLKTCFKHHADWFQRCPLSCSQTVFNMSLQRYHENNLPEPPVKANGS